MSIINSFKKIRLGDAVIVLIGKDKGASGKLIKFTKNNRAIVEGVNLIKKHVKPNPQKNIQGGIVERESSIHMSNIAVMNPVTKKADKIGIKILEDGRKVRYFKSNDELVEI